MRDVSGVVGGSDGWVRICCISHSSSSMISDKLSTFMIHVYVIPWMFAFEIWDNLFMY